MDEIDIFGGCHSVAVGGNRSRPLATDRRAKPTVYVIFRPFATFGDSSETDSIPVGATNFVLNL